MPYVPVILGTTRRGRLSPRVARYLLARMKGRFDAELLDLAEWPLPMLEERLSKRDDPPPGATEFSARLARAHAIVIVTPEYNGGYPGVLKNALDHFLPEFARKPVGIASVSGGPGAGRNVLGQLRQVLLVMGAYPIPVPFAVGNVGQSFTEDGQPTDTRFDKMADRFLDELAWVAARLDPARTV